MPFGQPASSYVLNLPELMQEIGQYLTTSEVITALQVWKRVTVVGRPRRNTIKYFDLRGHTALKQFVWKSEEPASTSVTDSQWGNMIEFIKENRMKIKSMTIEHRHRGCTQFWETFSRNPIPSLTSLRFRNIEISKDSAHYFWGVCRESCAKLRRLKPIYNDPKATAKTLQRKSDDGVHSHQSLDWPDPNENFMFLRIKAPKLPDKYDGDDWVELMEQCPRLEAWR
ncbi:hypothetical protein BGX26_008622 [Mortierella sp. AD094]|nr:hypothetical protein BGX26_008622 [Mortierella sp. AD094]